VLPARAPRVPGNAASAAVLAAPASAPARVVDAPLPRSAPLDPAAPRVADATAGRSVKPVGAEPADPRARCGERNFFSLLLCMKRECQSAAVSAHPECVKLREQESAQSSGSER
jgi:hypothetical protein